MSNLSSPSQARREGTGFNISFAEYLSHIVKIDTEIKSACIKLDEEGNYYWELDKNELSQLIEKLTFVLEKLNKID